MRAYFWGNMYLSSIQQGIQAAHVVAEMATMAHQDMLVGNNERSDMFYEWSSNHKTMILYSGGYALKIMELNTLFAQTKYPTQIFYEEENALNHAATCVGIILPQKVYNLAQESRETNTPVKDLVCGINDNDRVYVDHETGDVVECTVTDADKRIATLIAQSNLAN